MTTYSTIVFESNTRLICVRCFHKDQFVLPDFVQNALHTVRLKKGQRWRTHHIVPSGNNTLHVQITGKECHYSVWDNLAVFYEDATEVADHCRIVPDFEARANRDLITSTSNDLLQRKSVRDLIRRDDMIRSKPVARRSFAQASWDMTLEQLA